MGNEKLNKLLVGFIFLVVCFTLDRFSKIYVINLVQFKGGQIFLTDFLNLTLNWSLYDT